VRVLPGGTLWPTSLPGQKYRDKASRENVPPHLLTEGKKVRGDGTPDQLTPTKGKPLFIDSVSPGTFHPLLSSPDEVIVEVVEVFYDWEGYADEVQVRLPDGRLIDTHLHELGVQVIDGEPIF
jgi:hypothetical protein